MRPRDLISLSLAAVRAHALRSGLTALGIGVGIAAVVLLTSIGEGVNRFVVAEFTQFGTNLVAVTPGKTETFGISGAMVSNVRPLSLDDAAALQRIEGVQAVEPVVQGNASVEAGNRSRRTTVLGVGAHVPTVWSMNVALGRFLPDEGHQNPRGLAVLGAKLHRELFREASPLGQRVRIGGERYRVIGVMEPKGQMLGFDLDDIIFIPAAKALAMFNRESLMEIDLLYRPGLSSELIAEEVRRLMRRRHGHEDFTVITQDQMLDVLGSVLDVLTFAVSALGGISLVVGGVGILTIMTIAVNERVAEIGLLRALGARRGQVRMMFLSEAVALSTVGGLGGLAGGLGLAHGLALALPALPVHTPVQYALLAVGLAVLIGVVAGVAPAARAAKLVPVEALRAE